MNKQREEATETALRVEWRGAQRDASAAVTAASVAERAVAAATAAEGAALESQAVARAATVASARATETSRLAAEAATRATVAAEAERTHARADVAAADAAESLASERFQVAHHARRSESNQANRRHNEQFTADGATAEFETYNEFLGSTLEVSVDGERIEAKPILGNRGFRLASPPGEGCQVRVYYQIAGF